ncbi:MAG: SPOR domain-containing protein [Legionella sp.]
MGKSQKIELASQQQQVTGKYYTIQLAASRKKHSMHPLSQHKELIGKTRLRKITNTSGNWYVLTLGEYKNNTHAQNDAKQIANKLSQFKVNPWVRSTSVYSEQTLEKKQPLAEKKSPPSARRTMRSKNKSFKLKQ